MTRTLRPALSGVVATMLLGGMLAGQDRGPEPLFPRAEHDAAVPTPRSFLGYELGSCFTYHRDAVAYAEAVAAASPRVSVEPYGRTAGGRRLVLAVVTSEGNHARRDAVRERNRALQRDGGGEEDPEGPVVVWFGMGIHGDEASTVEAGLLLLHHLAAGRGPEVARVLDGVVLLLDVCSNPDGRDRFVTGVRDRRGARPSAEPEAWANRQPWPGGRTNHYLFDLNRDWFLQTQDTSRARARAYLEELPQVLADFHEMGSERTYYFSAPPGPPVNQHISDSIRTGWKLIGGRIAGFFDERAWPYWVGDVFPADYPGYGGAWPCFFGAVGMTFEQATSRGGLVRRRDGSVLSLAECMTRHAGAGWATLTAAASARGAVLSEYRRHFGRLREEAARDDLPWFVLTPRRDPDTLALLVGTLERNGIETRPLTPGASLTAEPLLGGRARTVVVPPGSYAVSARQPARPLVLALLDPEVEVSDEILERERELRREGRRSELYDVTSWNLPLLFGVEAWRAAGVPAGESGAAPEERGADPGDDPPVGYLVAGRRLGAHAVLARLLEADVRVGVVPFDFTLEDRAWSRGTLLVALDRNRGAAVRRAIAREAGAAGSLLRAVRTFRSGSGHDLGSGRIRPVGRQRIVVACGEGVSAYSFGAVRWLLEQAVPVEHACVPITPSRLRILDETDVLVLPDGGGFGRMLTKEALERFLERGGTVVALRGALDHLASEKVGLVPLERLEEKRTRGHGPVAGAILGARLDRDHWLSYGLPEDVSVQCRARRYWKAPEGRSPRVVLRFADAGAAPLLRSGVLIEGQAGLLHGAPVVTETRRGRGRIVGFSEDVVFRGTSPGLWKLFLNALLLAPRD